jgi:hypothetical protein
MMYGDTLNKDLGERVHSQWDGIAVEMRHENSYKNTRFTTQNLGLGLYFIL